MRKVILFFLICSLAVVPIFADEQLPDDSEPVQTNNDNTAPVVVDITQLLNNSSQTDDSKTDDFPQEVIALEPELVSVTSSQQRISASDATGFKAVLLGLIGDYETTITDYEYRTGSSGYTSHSINIERDWSWLCSCGVFSLLLYCTFRTIGGICARF